MIFILMFIVGMICYFMMKADQKTTLKGEFLGPSMEECWPFALFLGIFFPIGISFIGYYLFRGVLKPAGSKGVSRWLE